MKRFNKPALSGADQLTKLKSRGLLVADDAFALRRLRHIGYYRLSGYMLPFQIGGSDKDRHTFRPDTTFEQIVRLYVFDRKLRLLVLDAVERIEISVRAGLSGQIAVANGPHWYENPRLFDRLFNHERHLEEIDRHLANSTDVFIDHYNNKYQGGPPRPPCWMVFECMPFGTVSKIVKWAIPKQMSELCADYGLPQNVLASWLHAVSYARNLCAHHSRLWNRTLTITPIQAHRYRTELTPNNKFYALAVVIQVILLAIAPDNTWAQRLAKLLDEHSDVPITSMGFPPEWRDRPFWSASLKTDES